MTITLADVVARPPSGRGRALLLDSRNYAQRVLLQGKPIPWHEPTAYANFIGQAQSLLGPDIALLSLERFCDDAVSSNPVLRKAMGAKTRTGFALRSLLGDPETARRSIELATIFASTLREPVVLHIPSPMRWLLRTHHFSGEATTAGLSSEDAENVAIYIADWLRGFAALPISGLLLDDRAQAAQPLELQVPLEAYSPITNLATHYGWTFGLHRAETIALHPAEQGAIIPADFWSSGIGTPPEGSFLFAEIPEDAVPEAVLAAIRSLA